VVKFLGLLLKDLGRNKVRTALTALAVVVLVSIYTLASTVTNTVSQAVAAYSSQSRLMVREKWLMPSRFPIRYVPKIVSLSGVEDWTSWHFYFGALDNAGHNIAGIATRLDNLCEMHSGMDDLDPALLDALEREKNGVLMGHVVMEQMNWQVGQRFTVTSTSHVGKNLEFQVVGVLQSNLWARNFFFREDYYQEGLDDKDSVNILWLRVADEATAKHLAPKVEWLFQNSRDKLRVETESAGVGRFIGRASTLVNIIAFVVSILLLDMIVVLSNSIGMTVRERRQEMAIFKILGFQPSYIVTMVVGEAVALGAAGGLFGAGVTYLISALNASGRLPTRLAFLVQFPVEPQSIWQGLLVGCLVGFVGSVIPAYKAQKIQVAEAFANVG
jgi:putative ABC transport system permease protein